MMFNFYCLGFMALHHKYVYNLCCMCSLLWLTVAQDHMGDFGCSLFLRASRTDRPSIRSDSSIGVVVYIIVSISALCSGASCLRSVTWIWNVGAMSPILDSSSSSFTSHRHCKVNMATFQLYCCRKTICMPLRVLFLFIITPNVACIFRRTNWICIIRQKVVSLRI